MAEAGFILKRYQKGQVIFYEGEFADCMYDIRSGNVGIYANYGTLEEQMITDLKPGQYFGEMGVIEGQPRSATVVALTDVEAWMINGKTFAAYIQQQPVKIILILQSMSKRMWEVTEKYQKACDTVAEYMAAESKRRGKTPELVDRMRKLAAEKKN